MLIIPLAISPIAIASISIITILLYVFAIYNASKTVQGWPYFVWLLTILCIPVFGAMAYIIYHLSTLYMTKKHS